MDRKTIITIILAAILALICAFLIIRKNTITELPDIEDVDVKEEVIVEEVQPSDEAEKMMKETSEAEVLKPLSKSTVSKPAVQKVDNVEEPVFDQIVVQEGSVTEEVERDYGIRKVGENTFEITREFDFKSPKKYSFKGYGQLDEVSSN